MTIQQIPFNKLVSSSRNVRRAKATTSMVGSIAKKGVLMPLLVTEQIDEEGGATGFYSVHAGGRRFEALAHLISSKDKAHKSFTPSYLVNCIVRDAASAVDDSLTENFMREANHPADTYEAFAALKAEGATTEDLANRYDMAVDRVRRILKLGNCAAELLELHRNDELTFGQMQAYALSDDHEQQRGVLERLGPNAPEYQIRNAIVANEVSSRDDRRAKFVGEEAYLAAGGAIRRDLFSEGSGYFNDAGLLERLALDKLESTRTGLTNEGWAWVEARIAFDYSDREQFQVLQAEEAELSDSDKERLGKLYEAREALIDDESEEAYEEHDRLCEEISTIEDGRPRVFTAEQKEFSGAVVALSHSGEEVVYRGLVKATDKRKAAAHSISASLKKSGASAEEVAKEVASVGLSGALIENLTSHRAMALRYELAQSPRVAFIVAVHALVAGSFYRTWDRSAVTIRGQDSYNDPARHCFGEDVQAMKAALLLAEQVEAAKAQLPGAVQDLWAYLVVQEDAELHRLLALALSQNLFTAQVAGLPASSRAVSGEQIGVALGLNMADHWEATAQTYFSRIPKASIVAEVTEALSADVAKPLAGMTKAAAALEAERLLTGKGWLPAILRTSTARD